MRGVWIYSWTIQHNVTKTKNFSGRFCNYDLKGYIFVYICTPTLNKFNTKSLVLSDSVLLNYSFTFQALYTIRYHSFFPWHCSGDYNYLCDDKDMKMLEWVKEFKWETYFIKIKTECCSTFNYTLKCAADISNTYLKYRMKSALICISQRTFAIKEY